MNPFLRDDSSMEFSHAGPLSDLIAPLDMLTEWAAQTPDRVALVVGEEEWTYSQLASESRRLAHSLYALGVKPGDRVAIHMLNCVEAVLSYIACWRLGAIGVPINVRYKTPEVAALLARTKPVVYLGHAPLLHVVSSMDPDIFTNTFRFIVGLERPTSGFQSWSALLNMISRVDADIVLDELGDLNTPALLLSTSGTTGQSKLVVWTQRTLSLFGTATQERSVGRDRVIFSTMQMMHGSGCWMFAVSLLTGALLVTLPQFDPELTLDAIAKYRCTTFWSFPFAFTQCAQAQLARPRDLDCLTACLAAGDVCSQQTEDLVASAFKLPLLSIWAAIEEPIAMAPSDEPGPFTRPLPSTEVRLVDKYLEEVADGDIGQMLIRSPGTSLGYWIGPTELLPFPNGWFHSGDLMRREPDGKLRHMGRTKDLIIRGDSNVSPVEVEAVLRRQPFIADVAVVGIPDALLGQRVGAILVLQEGAPAEAADAAIDRAKSYLADYKVPEAVCVAEAIPRNNMMKVNRREVAHMLAHGGSVAETEPLPTSAEREAAEADRPELQK